MVADLHQFDEDEEQDPGLGLHSHKSEKSDPNPHQCVADPQPCSAGGGETDLNAHVSHGGPGCGVGAPGVHLTHKQRVEDRLT